VNDQQQADLKKPRLPTIYDPAKTKGKLVPGRKPQKKFPYNTKLDSGKHTIQVCCKCFSRPTQGACSAHHAEQYLRLCEAEQALEEGCGLAWDLGTTLGGLQALLGAVLEAAKPQFQGDRRGDGGGGPNAEVVAILPPHVMRKVQLAFEALNRSTRVEPVEVEEPQQEP